MLIYTVLVLLARTDIRIGIPTSVILMAFTSLVGLASNQILSRIDPVLYHFDREVFANWLAAAPIVALGAPFGALMVNVIPRGPTLIIVSLLCVGQFVWTCIHEHVSWTTFALAIGGVLACNVLFHFMYRIGLARAKRLQVAPPRDAGPVPEPTSAAPKPEVEA
jgi:hypothetical protein